MLLPSIVGSYSSTKCDWMNWMVKADLPTPVARVNFWFQAFFLHLGSRWTEMTFFAQENQSTLTTATNHDQLVFTYKWRSLWHIVWFKNKKSCKKKSEKKGKEEESKKTRRKKKKQSYTMGWRHTHTHKHTRTRDQLNSTQLNSTITSWRWLKAKFSRFSSYILISWWSFHWSSVACCWERSSHLHQVIEDPH